jgi:translation initiation factor 3 subunit M
LCSLSNLFNSLPRSSPLRSVVYTNILNLAVSNDDLETLQLSQSEVSKWLSEWDVSNDEKAAFLKALVDAYAKASEPYVHFPLPQT